MGQQCSRLTCRHVENPETAEMSRVDSPDPVMYDLMRKSIQATSARWNDDGTDVVEISGHKSGKRRPVGQSHLLYKNNIITTTKGSVQTKTQTSSGELPPTRPGASVEKNGNVPRIARRGMESRSGGKTGSVMSKTGDGQPSAGPNTNTAPLKESTAVTTEELLPPPPSKTHLKCPTRLLIRRRSLRVIEEGGGTHIYAIRYPEDTSQTFLSEQAVPFSSAVRQEQCPPRKATPSNSTTLSGSFTSSSIVVTPTFTTSPMDNSREVEDPKTPKATPLSKSPQHRHGPSPKQPISAQARMPDSSVLASSQKGPDMSFPATPENIGDMFSATSMAAPPLQSVLEWVTVSEEHNIYVADVGLTAAQCDELVATTEQVCRGQYAAYTYAKQTLGCREYPILAHASLGPIHTIVHAITTKFPLTEPTDNVAATPQSPSNSMNVRDKDSNAKSKDDEMLSTGNGGSERVEEKDEHHLQLDDREPHIVKYDVTKKERQKLDMHTDKSEWTFLIALSNGCGVDYEGGGTYFECLDATVHIQRGHALVFPGKLRHCGQKITSGLRFLLVGFLVDKQTTASTGKSHSSGKSPNGRTTITAACVPSREITRGGTSAAVLADAVKKDPASMHNTS